MGLRDLEVFPEDPSELRKACAAADAVLEHSDTFLGRGDLRPLIRHRIEELGGNLAGADADAAHLCDDKLAAKERLARAGLRVPRSLGPGGRDGVPAADDSPDSLASLRFPAVVKRPFDHGSRGLALVKSARALQRIAGRLALEGEEIQEIIVEEFIEGRELAASVVEARGRPVVMPLVEIGIGRRETYRQGIKWGKSPLPIRGASLDRRVESRVKACVLRAFRALGLRDYARFDLRLAGDGIPVFLEANARPSVEDGTEFRLAARLAGLEEEGLLSLMLRGSARRGRARALQEALAPFVSSAEETLCGRRRSARRTKGRRRRASAPGGRP